MHRARQQLRSSFLCLFYDPKRGSVRLRLNTDKVMQDCSGVADGRWWLMHSVGLGPAPVKAAGSSSLLCVLRTLHVDPIAEVSQIGQSHSI